MGCRLKRFVREYLPSGIITEESVNKTRMLLYFLCATTLIRIGAVLVLALDFFNLLKKWDFERNRLLLVYIVSFILIATEILIVFCFLALLTAA